MGQLTRRRVKKRRRTNSNSKMKFSVFLAIIIITILLGYLTARFIIGPFLGYDSDEIAKTCPNCEEVFYKRFTHLPLYGLSDEQIEYMADAVLEAVAEMQAGK